MANCISYFIAKSGAKTRRISGPPGKGHIELAQEVLGIKLDKETDLYKSMFQHGYIRVMEDADGLLGIPGAIYIDSPKELSGPQRDFALDQSKDGKRVVVNNQDFVEMRQNKAVIPPLIG